jgi:5'-nucleotidase
MTRPLILVTNDDGIASPGLAAAVAAVDPLGDLLIAAPATQQTSMGRSRTRLSELDGCILPRDVQYQGKTWPGFAVQATPALVVEHAIQELAPRRINLVVSGINYGENVGSCITISGTIGAAMEAAECGLLALAFSMETEVEQYFRHDRSVDFSAALYFVRFFAERVLGKQFPPDVDVFKVDIPRSATPESGWMMTAQDRLAYYRPTVVRETGDLFQPSRLTHSVAKGKFSRPGTDAYALSRGLVSITPLSLDHTSRTPLDELQKLIDRHPDPG